MFPPESFAQRLVRTLTFAIAIFLYFDLYYGLSLSHAAIFLVCCSLSYSLLSILLPFYTCKTCARDSVDAKADFMQGCTATIDLLFASAYGLMALLLCVHFHDSPVNTALFAWKVAGIAVSALQALLFAWLSLFWPSLELLSRLIERCIRCRYCEHTSHCQRCLEDPSRDYLNCPGDGTLLVEEGKLKLSDTE
ncbi:hypothetical protein EV356DRAFT_376911 [Viridothelium virens]|uniref:Uncharacterized protein n=1 Tax=Viridothelium virens TaxID=1048519 RepID=A0A6A6GV34_VIRVR|nr:hypothetical protein EV356DRAFT_376911 [Viridothelium virens]